MSRAGPQACYCALTVDGQIKQRRVTGRRRDVQVHRLSRRIVHVGSPVRSLTSGTPRGAGCDNLEPLARYIFVYIIPGISSAATKIYLPFAMSRLPRARDGKRFLNRDSSARFGVASRARSSRTEEGRRGEASRAGMERRWTRKCARPGRGKRDGERRHIISTS